METEFGLEDNTDIIAPEPDTVDTVQDPTGVLSDSVNLVEVSQQIPTFELLTPELQEYVIENFDTFDEEDIRSFQGEDFAETREQFEEQQRILEDDKLISEAFRGTPTKDSVSQERRIRRSRVRARTSELFPELEGEELENITDTVSEILEREELRGNPMSALYGEAGSMNETTFSELESFTTVGESFNNLKNSSTQVTPDDFSYQGLQEGPLVDSGVDFVKSALNFSVGIGRSFGSQALDAVGFLGESPALVADFSDAVAAATEPYIKDLEKNLAGNDDIKFDDLFGVQAYRGVEESRKKAAAAVRNIFRDNRFSGYVRSIVEAPTDMDGEVFERIKEGDYAGAGKQASYMVSGLMGEVTGTLGVGGLLRLAKVAPKLSVMLGTISAERQQQHLLSEGFSVEQATPNALTYGLVNAVLSEMIVVDKLRHMTGTTLKEYGAKSATEFAMGAVANTAKTMAFDGTLMATTEGMLAVTDYVTGVTDDLELDDVLSRAGNGFFLGAGASLVLGAPTRYVGFKSRVNRAQEHFDRTMGLNDVYQMVQEIDNPRMRDAVVTLMKDSPSVPESVYVSPKDLQATLNMTEADFIQRSGINADVFQAAKDTNQPISVPIDLVADAMAANPNGRLNFGEFRSGVDGPTAIESAAFIDSIDKFYSGVLRRQVKAGSLVDELMGRVKLKDLPSRSSDSLARSAMLYAKSMYNGSFGRWKDTFGKAEDVTINTPDAQRAPRVEFTQTEVPDVAPQGQTLKSLPPTLDITPETARSVFPEKVVDTMITAETARAKLESEYKSFTDKYRIVDEADRIANQELQDLSEPNFSATKLRVDITENILNDQSLSDAAELVLGERVSEQTGQPIRINYESFVERYGKTAAAQLSRGMGKTLFTKKKGRGLLLDDALVELGLTYETFRNTLADPDVRGVVREGGVLQYATSEADKLTNNILRNMERYNKMANMDRDPLISYYERWLNDGAANEAIDKHLSPELETVRADEIKRLEQQLPTEFRKRNSNLVKSGRIPKEMKEAITAEVLEYDYKYVQKNAFLMDALNLERYYDRQSAEALRFGNMEQAYINKAQAAKMHEYAKAQYKAIRLAKKTKQSLDRITSTDIMDFNQQGYDTDYVFAARLVMNKAGITRNDFGAEGHLSELAKIDPAKYEKLVELFDRYVPETQEGMSLAQYSEFALAMNDRIEAAKGEALSYKIGDKTVSQAVESIFDALLERERTLIDARQKGKFSINANANYKRLYNAEIESGKAMEKIDRKALRLKANELTRTSLNLDVKPERLGAMANYVSQSFTIMGDFLYSLNVPELSRLADMFRESNSSLINALNAPGGHVPFLKSITQYVNQNAKDLAYRGVRKFGPNEYTASQMNSLVMHLGNQGNFDRLAARNFGVSPEVLTQYVKEAIDSGVLTESHFNLAQVLGGRYEQKFNELQPHVKRTFGRFTKPIEKNFPLAGVVPEGWIKGGWYAPVKSEYSPISDKSWSFKTTETSMERSLQEFSENGFLQDLNDILSEQPMEASYQKRRSVIEGEKMSLDFPRYLNQLLHIEKTIYTRDAAVAANQVFLDPSVIKMLDAISPGIMENTIWPAVKAFNDQSVHSGAIGDIRMESANQAMSKMTAVMTGAAGKLQIAFNYITPFLNVSESAKVVDLLAHEGMSGRQSRMLNLMTFAGRMADLALHKQKVKYLQELMPYLKARQDNNIVPVQRSFDASIRNSLAFRSGIPASRKAAQMNAFIDNVSRAPDHWSQGLVDATAASMFLDGYLAKGIPLDEALRLAERAVERTMPGYFSSELYAASRSNTGRLIFQYTNWAIKTLNYGASRGREAAYNYADNMVKRYGAYVGVAMRVLVLGAIMDDTVRGLLSGRNSLDELQDDFMADPLLATSRLAGQSVSSSFDRIPVVGGTMRRAGLQVTSAVLGDDETRSGYLYNTYKAGTLIQGKDLIELPVFAVMDTPLKAARGLYRYGTEGEYQRAYEIFGNTRYSSVDSGTAASEVMALIGMMGVPMPRGPGVRNSVKYLYNLSTGEDSMSESGVLLDLLRGRGENLKNPPSRKRKQRR